MELKAKILKALERQGKALTRAALEAIEGDDDERADEGKGPLRQFVELRVPDVVELCKSHILDDGTAAALMKGCSKLGDGKVVLQVRDVLRVLDLAK